MATVSFKKQDLQSLVGGEECPALEVVKDNITGKSRWSVQHDLVFKDTATGKFYVTSYSEGATEQQDEAPFEYEPEAIACDEVQPVEKVVIEYVRTPTGNVSAP